MPFSGIMSSGFISSPVVKPETAASTPEFSEFFSVGVLSPIFLSLTNKKIAIIIKIMFAIISSVSVEVKSIAINVSFF